MQRKEERQKESFICVWLSWTVARQAALSVGFSRQEYWSGLPVPSPGDLPDTGIEPESLVPPELGGRFFTTSATWEGQDTGMHIDKWVH